MLNKSAFIVFKANLKQFLLSLFFAGIPRQRPSFKNKEMGLNLIGYYQGDLGLGEALRYVAKAIQGASIPFLVRQFQAPLQSSQNNRSLHSFLAPYCKYPINCIAINPDLLYFLPKWVSFSEWARRYNIGYWFWELEDFPKKWHYALPLIDEIWVNSEFMANTLRKVHPQVVKIPFAVEFQKPSSKFTKEYFGLPKDSFVFLTSFDFQSSIARKNPQAAIDAFLEAFPVPNNNTYIVIKSINGHLHPQAFDQLTLQTENHSHILLMDQQLSTEEMHGLFQCADCYVSLHRSEGLGLGMAEAMYLGKPVIATAYSGNLEFMNQANACLVSYTKIAVSDGEYLDQKNQSWADPNVHEASKYMEKIFSDFEFRTQIGNAAQKWMLEHHSYDVMGLAIADRLRQIIQ